MTGRPDSGSRGEASVAASVAPSASATSQIDRALIIGASSYAAGSGLVGYRSIRESARRVARTLGTACGLPADRITVLVDADDEEILAALREQAAKVRSGAFLFYYIGHGLLTTTAGGTSFSLAAANARLARDGSAQAGSVAFEDVSDVMASTGQPSVAILDCCFSANAGQHLSALQDPRLISAVPFGMYLLTAAGFDGRAFGPDPQDASAPPRPTLFSGALTGLLDDGDSRRPAILTLEDCYRHLLHISEEHSPDTATRFPRPWALQSGSIGRLRLALNPAVKQPAPIPDEEPDPDVECPFLGLSPYRPSDAHLYAGRARALNVVVRELVTAVEGGLPFLLTGPSGVGKSSLVEAGLVPLLEREAVPGWPESRGWPILRLFPGTDPLSRLAQALADAGGPTRREALRALREDPSSLVRLLRPVAGRGGGRVVLVVDQFEELSTRLPVNKADGIDRRLFVKALVEAAKPVGEGGAGAAVIVVVRGDRFTACTETFPELLDSDRRNYVVVPAMTEAELRQAVLEPAATCGLSVMPELLTQLLTDLRAGAPAALAEAPAAAEPAPASAEGQGYNPAGVLPLLSHALAQTFSRRSGRTLTLRGYVEIGGVWGSVAAEADRVFDHLTELDGGQDTARVVLLGMVQLGQNADDSRRRLDLENHALLGVQQQVVNRVVERFTARRLITLDRDADGRRTATLTHEALLRSWPRLQGWIEQDRAGLYLRQQLTEASLAWRRAGRDLGDLYRGARLETAREWRDGQLRGDVPGPVDEFISAGVRLEKAERRRARRARRALQTAAGVIASALVAYLVFQHHETDVARHQALVALSQQAAASAETLEGSDVPDSMLVALSAYRLDANDQTLSALLDTSSQDAAAQVLQPLGQFVGAEALSPTAPVMAIGAQSQKADAPAVTLWDVSDPGRPEQLSISLPGPYRGIEDLAFSPDGKTLFATTAAGDGGLWSWNIAGALKGTVTGTRLPGTGAEGYQGLAVGPGGSMLAATDTATGAVHLWSLSPSGSARALDEATGAMPDQNAEFVFFAPDSSTLVVGQAGALWRLAVSPTGAQASATEWLPASADVTAAAFDRTGDRLATGSRTGTLDLWQVTATGLTASGDPVDADAAAVETVAFSPDGESVATGSADETAKVWDTETGRLTQTLDMDSIILQVAFTDQSDALAVLDGATSVQLWRFPGSLLTGTEGEVYSVAAADGGRLVAAASQDGYIHLWSVNGSHSYRDVGEPLAMNADGEFPTAVAFDPSGDLLAAGDYDGDVDVWNVQDPAHPVLLPSPAQIPPPLVASPGGRGITSLAFIPGHDAFAVGTGEGKVYLVQLAGRSSMSLDRFWIGPENATTVYQVAVDSTGDIMVNATDQGDFVEDISDLADAKSIGSLLLPGGNPNGFDKLAFSHSGDILATGGELTSARDAGALYDLANLNAPRFLGYFSGPSASVQSMAFSPDDQTLAAGSADHDIWLWNVHDPSDPTPLATLAGHGQQVDAVAFATNDLLASGSVDATVRLWDTQPAIATDGICSYYPQNVYSIEGEWERWFPGVSFAPACP